jgi:hypothetical protein
MDFGSAYMVDRSAAPTVRQWGTGFGVFVAAGQYFDARLTLGWALRDTAVTVAGTLRAYLSVGFQF